MFIILGAAGHVGSEVTNALRKAGQDVLAVVHSSEKAAMVRAVGVEPAIVDVGDDAALRAVFQRGRRAFLLNPPGDPQADSNEQELRTARSISQALVGSGLEKVVVASTYGAQPGDAIGDLSTLHDFEQGVQASGIPAAINRGAYYFTNLDMLLDPARSGILPTAFPADFVLPMVAPADLGKAAAERLASGLDDVGIRDVEGPARYNFADVADVLARLLGRPVEVATTERSQWEESFRQLGFSAPSARAFARMTEVTVDQPDLPENPWRGAVTLADYLGGQIKS